MGSTPINTLIYMVHWHLTSPSLTTSQGPSCCNGDEGNAIQNVCDGLALACLDTSAVTPPSLGVRRTAEEVQGALGTRLDGFDPRPTNSRRRRRRRRHPLAAGNRVGRRRRGGAAAAAGERRGQRALATEEVARALRARAHGFPPRSAGGSGSTRSRWLRIRIRIRRRRRRRRRIRRIRAGE